MKHYDVIVVGGGTAGALAAGTAAALCVKEGTIPAELDGAKLKKILL